MKTPQLASLSLDLDNQWSYMKIHGDAGWETFPSYLDIFVPRVLNLLDELELNITFFIVGQDAVIDKNLDYLKEIPQWGHEIGNHSFHHESWLHTYSKQAMEREIREAEEVIEAVTGEQTTGFRGPGFSWGPHLLEVLESMGYEYDASTLPTYIGPLARMYYFWTANLSPEEKEERKGLFGSFKDGFRPVKPYFWELSHGKRLLEIPVTTMPVFKLPFHLSYLLYLSNISKALMNLYLDTAIRLCKWTGTAPSFLLHPLDLVSGDQVPELKFFPGMKIATEKKEDLFRHVIGKLSKHFSLVDMKTFASSYQHKQKTLPSLEPVVYH